MCCVMYTTFTIYYYYVQEPLNPEYLQGPGTGVRRAEHHGNGIRLAQNTQKSEYSVSVWHLVQSSLVVSINSQRNTRS